ncbi:SMP-30/gluconolactonase/LRE family protein [Myxococcota bacterium]|nr:SMP-30/gluconolactonase/LRE family protein [Myxococcota bacterium]
MQTIHTTTLLGDLAFGEGPRWREGLLWFSDMHSQKVLTVDLAGRRSEVCSVENDPSGLGWLPDGRLLVVSMRNRQLLRQEPDGQLAVHADLSAWASFHCNDMVVNRQGQAYVGHFGWDLHGGGTPCLAQLLRVDPDGTIQLAADGLDFPNGSVITPDGRTLIVAETMGRRLTAFDIESDGRLTHRRVWAEFEALLPDGIALDADGGSGSPPQSAMAVFELSRGGKSRIAWRSSVRPMRACSEGRNESISSSALPGTVCRTTASAKEMAKSKWSKSIVRGVVCPNARLALSARSFSLHEVLNEPL